MADEVAALGEKLKVIDANTGGKTKLIEEQAAVIARMQDQIDRAGMTETVEALEVNDQLRQENSELMATNDKLLGRLSLVTEPTRSMLAHRGGTTS